MFVLILFQIALQIIASNSVPDYNYWKVGFHPNHPWNFKISPWFDRYHQRMNEHDSLRSRLQAKVCALNSVYNQTYAIYEIPDVMLEFNDCSTVAICNSTYCMWLSETSSVFSFKWDDPRNTTIKKAGMRNSVFPEHWNETKTDFLFEFLDDRNLNFNLRVQNSTLYSISLPHEKLTHWHLSYQIMDLLTNITAFSNEVVKEMFKKKCSVQSRKHLLIEQNGNLPTKCHNIWITNGTIRYSYGLVSQLFNKLYNRQFMMCKLQEVYPPRYTRASVSDISPNNSVAITVKDKRGRGLLNFNLPGYRYCGPGNDIEQMDDLGGPINSLDSACRTHDLVYLTGNNTAIADNVLLEEVWVHSKLFYPAFFAAFQAKRYFEMAFGKSYTSSLYFYTDDFKPSLTLQFYQHSAYDHLDKDSLPLDGVGIQYENKWREIVHDIWQGSCITNAHPPDTQVDADDNDYEIPSGSKQPGDVVNSLQDDSQLPGSHNSNSEDQGDLQSETGDDLSISLNSNSASPSKCNIIINEVLATRVFESLSLTSRLQYIELAKICTADSRQYKVNHLDGYVILIITFGATPQIVFSAVLSKQNVLKQSAEQLTEGRQKYFYFVLGSKDIPKVSMRFNKNVHHIGSVNANHMNAIPAETSTPTAVVLLRFKRGDRNEKNYLLKRSKYTHLCQPVPLNSAIKKILKPNVVDVFLYGTECSASDSGVLKELWADAPPNCKDVMFSSDSPDDSFTYENLQSFSRCSTNNLPFQTTCFVDAIASPMENNICPTVEVIPTNLPMELFYPFVFRGSVFQSSAQKLMLNTWYSIEEAKKDSRILEGEAQLVAARLLGVSRSSITRANARWNNNAIRTPGKSRKGTCRVQTLIDSFDRDVIRRLIVDYYKNGQAPLLNNLYDRFMEYKNEDPISVDKTTSQATTVTTTYEYEQAPITHPTPSVPPSPNFRCSRQTFSKVVKALGFKYGKIDGRAAIIQRADIVKWRGRYLRRLRENAASPKPKKLVYIDETWIDPHLRLAKGWVPKKCKRFKDMAAYSYANAKVGKGPRLIVLAAVDEDGIIVESINVFKISKSETALDYHENVNKESFLKWYKTQLLDVLNARKEEYIIIMDNAPYHSSTLIPKRHQKKQVFYDWIIENKAKSSVPINLPPINKIRKWELEEITDNLIKSAGMKNDLYEVDKLTVEHNQEVLRLPPYNCDLNVIEYLWKYIKTEIKRHNTKQDLNAIKIIAEEEMKKYGREKIKNHWSHIIKVGEKYWEEDGWMDEVQNYNVIIPLEDENDEDENDEDEDCEFDITEGEDDGNADVQMDYGGDITVEEDCDLNSQIFDNEKDIGSYMFTPNARNRGRGRGRGRGIGACRQIDFAIDN